MSDEYRNEIVNSARSISPFFQVKVELRVFGQLVWSFVLPPSKRK